MTLVRTTPEENYRMGETVVERLGNPRTPAVVLVPMRGFSGLDISGGPFRDPEAVDAFVEGVQSCLAPNVSVVKVDHHINEPEFAEALVKALTSCIAASS